MTRQKAKGKGRNDERRMMNDEAARFFIHRSSFRIHRFWILFAFLLLPFAFSHARARAHEPITTKVRFNKEVVRIFERSCTGCHRPEGIAMSLATYEDARPWAKAIKEEILEKRMPPWRAVKGYGEFANAPALTQREIDLIINWVEGGAPKGDDKDLPASPLYSTGWPMGKPDLILRPDAAAEVSSDADEYRTFTLPTNLKEDRWLSAIDLLPSNGAVVHCATVSISGKQTLDKWIPGQKRVRLPEAVAELLPAGLPIILKIHYRNSGEATKDQSAVGLYFTKPPRRQAQEISITTRDQVIPEGAQSYRVNASITIEDDAEALGIRPLVSPLIVSTQVTAYRPDGTEEVLIWARGYWQDWQQTYYLKRAARLPKGTRVEVITYFDNSAENRDNPNDPPKQIRLSDLTTDPLCALVITRSRTSD